VNKMLRAVFPLKAGKMTGGRKKWRGPNNNDVKGGQMKKAEIHLPYRAQG